ncbi:MAG: hypothetical protein OHK93_001967 [Ramalina farinacea]|uniref:CAP-Gly domain-containing protein n=1 Tax=Ramalina farinacea TaxID=258253 RepID=A0AA43QTU1_9LECA|nr:hypothetical protein [Ramalina farinacea]
MPVVPIGRYVGERLAFQGERCTVRYVGGIEKKRGDWLGVEWDDPRKGKHDGSYEGFKYFQCKSPSSTAASFIRPNRPANTPLGFIEAIKSKYATAEDSSDDSISISGKTVEEVGFDKIQRQLAALPELKIIILDGLPMKSLSSQPSQDKGTGDIDLDLPSEAAQWLQQLKVEELDLSRTLLERWSDALSLVGLLPKLSTLKLSGNRFRCLSSPPLSGREQTSLAKLESIALDDTLIDGDEIASLIAPFPALHSLSASYNNIQSFTSPLPTPHLQHLDLSYNRMSSLEAIQSIFRLHDLRTLSLRGNPITEFSHPSITFPSLSKLDISSTNLPHLPSLNGILKVFPSLTSLLTKDTPLSKLPSATLLTTARLGTLKELNYSPITPAERANAELYYISTIVASLASTLPSSPEERAIFAAHPRWRELCSIHGVPDIPRESVVVQDTKAYPPGSLGSRVVRFHFAYTPPPTGDAPDGSEKVVTQEQSKLIPTSISTYRLQAIVARLFKLRAREVRLVLETNEVDPVDQADSFINEEDGAPGAEREGDQVKLGKEEGKWRRREEELVGSTRPVSDWLPMDLAGRGAEARVRGLSRGDTR